MIVIRPGAYHHDLQLAQINGDEPDEQDDRRQVYIENYRDRDTD